MRELAAITAICLVASVGLAADNFYVTGSELGTETFDAYADDSYVGGSARTANVYVSNSGTLWTMNTGFDNGFTGAKSYWHMSDGSKILVTGDAEINNNMSDLVNARVFQVNGANTGEVIEFAEGFQADLGSASDPTGGLSTYNMNNATMITHHTRNLPAIWKYIPDGGDTALSHHGLLVFTSGPNATWQVRTNDQEYEGGTYWKQDWTLDVAADVSLTYVDTWYERHEVGDGADIGFGPYTGYTGTTFHKTGNGTLNLNGEMGWQSDSTMAVQAGTVNIKNYDAAYQWDYGYMNGSGQHLQVQVSDGAAVHLNAPTNGIASADSDGVLGVGAGTMNTTGDLSLSGTAEMKLSLAADDLSATKVWVGSDASVDGRLWFRPADGHSITRGQVYEVLGSMGDLTGEFAEIDGPYLDYTYDRVNDVLEIETTYMGDANNDGAVDVSDLGMLAGNWRTDQSDWSAGDFNGDGTVDVSDLGILAGSWRAGTEPSPATVPEPATISLLGLAGIALGRTRRRR